MGKSYMTDLGFDLGLFSDRLNVAFDWYRTDTKDILFEKTCPMQREVTAPLLSKYGLM